jgi:hypothetical protein
MEGRIEAEEEKRGRERKREKGTKRRGTWKSCTGQVVSGDMGFPFGQVTF